MKNVIQEVKQEIKIGTKKFGEQNNPPVEWVPIIAKGLGGAAQEAVAYTLNHPAKGIEEQFPAEIVAKARLKRYRKELIQLACVTIKAIESLDRNELNDGENDSDQLGAFDENG